MKIKILAVIVLILVIAVAIKHVDVMASGQRGLHTEWNKNHVIDSDVDFNKFELLQAALENRTDWPAGPVLGQIIYRTDLLAAYVWNGTEWSLLARRVNYWSCPGVKFVGDPAAAFEYGYDTGDLYAVAGAEEIHCSVELPHGAVVTAVIVTGSEPTDTWRFGRAEIPFPAPFCDEFDEMASAAINTEDVTIANPTIDNSLYRYWIHMTLSNNKVVCGVRITYLL